MRIVAQHDPKLAAFPLAVKPKRSVSLSARTKVKTGADAVKLKLDGLAQRFGSDKDRRRGK